MSTSTTAALQSLGATWQLGYCLVPERGPDGQVVGLVRWSPEGGLEPEHGRQRGLIYAPEAVASGGQSPETPILAVESIEDLLEAHRAGFTAIARPYVSQGYEAIGRLLTAKHAASVPSPTACSVLAACALCERVERTAASVAYVPVPLDFASLADWLGTFTNPDNAAAELRAHIDRARRAA